MDKREVSMAVVNRLPRYYRYLVDMDAHGIGRISSGALAEMMGLTASQIRQDLNCFGAFGQQGYGYNVKTLASELAAILNLDKGHTAVVVGTGNLGKALLNNFNFARAGVSVLAGFDADRAAVGQMIGGVPVLHIDMIENFVSQKKPDFGILTLPKDPAKDVAARLSKAGIRGLWNFTSADLFVPEITVPVENVHFSESLMILSYRQDMGAE